MKSHPLGSIEERVEILKNVSIFAKTEEKVLLKIAEALSEELTEANEPIFYKGDEGKKMYIILTGSVRVHDGDYTFATLKAGQVFGEYALLDTEERSASITTLESATLLVLEQETFYEIMVNHVQILQGILQVLVGRARQNNKLQEELAREKKRIQEQNEEIKIQNEEILTQNEEIIQQQEQIEIQNGLLSEKNGLITSSINYARNIQSALLADSSDFKKLFPESFIYYQPKDIVSGDFYWFYRLPHAPDKIIIICADCTGHGVPGAFMSFLGMTYIRQIVEFQKTYDLSEILYQLNKSIFLALKQESKPHQDGMDLAICLLDKQKHQLEFAGARGNIFYLEHPEQNHSEIQVLKGDLMPIGGYSPEKRFTTHTLDFAPGTLFYMFTDGYRDQFGEELNQKYMMKRFKQLVLAISQLPMNQQFEFIQRSHIEWRGRATQTDDILVMGYKV